MGPNGSTVLSAYGIKLRREVQQIHGIDRKNGSAAKILVIEILPC